VVYSPGVFVSELPSSASELIGTLMYGQQFLTTGRLWDGWVELLDGGWLRLRGENSSCWALADDANPGSFSMRRASGQLLEADGPRILRTSDHQPR
ncbi:unnamed protein product, partial [Polarella glacialis]